MSTPRSGAARCPTCKKPVVEDSEARPFCGSRCRTIDLGGWLDGRYRIAGEQHLDESGEAGAAPEDSSERSEH